MIQAPDGTRERLAEARRLAAVASDVLLSWFGRGIAVGHKGATDLVTAADRASEECILEGILAAFPGDAVLGEEGGWSGAADAPWRWVVDPLDGTTNFVHGVSRFAVSIAAVHGGEPVLGVIASPTEGRVFHGSVGQGAFLNDAPIHVSDTRDLGSSLLATGFPYDRAKHAESLLAPVARAFVAARGVRRMGAAALDMADVARGVFDGYWEPRLGAWDVAAGAVLVREAGGRLTAYGGRPFDLFKPQVLASNGHIHEALREMVGDE